MVGMKYSDQHPKKSRNNRHVRHSILTQFFFATYFANIAGPRESFQRGKIGSRSSLGNLLELQGLPDLRHRRPHPLDAPRRLGVVRRPVHPRGGPGAPRPALPLRRGPHDGLLALDPPPRVRPLLRRALGGGAGRGRDPLDDGRVRPRPAGRGVCDRLKPHAPEEKS